MNANTPTPETEQELARQFLAALDRQPASACPDTPRLAAYLDARLDPRETAQLEDHLAACPTCRRAVIEARELLAEPGELPTPGLVAGAREVVRRIEPQGSRSSPWSRVPRWAAAAAAVVALGVAGLKAGETVRRAQAPARTEPAVVMPFTLTEVDTSGDVFARLAANGEEDSHE
jgi:anti-sigma factor RsiW